MWGSSHVLAAVMIRAGLHISLLAQSGNSSSTNPQSSESEAIYILDRQL